MLPEQERKYDEDSNFEEVLLEGKSSTSTTKNGPAALSKVKTMLFNKEQDSHALEGMMGTMFRRLSTGTKVLTQTITESLQTECISKPEPGTGISQRQSLIMSSFIGKLENEEVYDDDDENSVFTNTSEFVGGKRSCHSDGDLLFRHQLSTSESLLGDRLGDASESEHTSYLSPEGEQQEEDPIETDSASDHRFSSLLDSTSNDTTAIADAPIPAVAVTLQ